MEDKLPLGLTFDDVLLVPGYSDFERNEIKLKTKLSRNIELDLPLVSAPMDTVTESRLAIALAELGGIGFIHRNLTISDQAAEVTKVKTNGYLVGAAIGSSAGFEARVEALIKAGADVLLIDSAHGYSQKVIATLKSVKTKYKLDVIVGNVATASGAKALCEAGADGLRVGMGPGAICSTRIISGMGVPQLSALFETSKVATRYKVPIIADGGIVYSGDVVKALAAGASSVMMGRMLAASNESAGKLVKLTPEQVPARFQSILNGTASYDFKQYRGMGSVAAMERGKKVSSEDEFHGKNYQGDTLIAEGVEGLVPVAGSLKSITSQLVGGLLSGMYYVGARTITELHRTRFMRISQASLSESHPHDLLITNPGDNYH